MSANRRIYNKLLAATCLTLFLSGGLGACSKKNEQNGDKIIHFGNSGEPKSLDPYVATGTWEHQIISDMLEGLTTSTADGKTISGMATSWTTSPDGLVWTFKLRDAKWSDGVPVTADDFVYGWQRLLTMKPPTQYASMLFLVKNAEQVFDGKLPKDALGIKAIDPKTLQVTLEHPASYLLDFLTHPISYPVPKHIVEKYGDSWINPEHIVVNGAFKLEQWSPNDFIYVSKNPKYYDAKNVCLDGVYYYPTQDDIAAERQVKTDRLDIHTNFGGSRREEIDRTMPGYARISDYNSITYYIFNIKKKPFNDPKVREALSLAIDREFITNEILKGGQRPAYSLVPKGIFNYDFEKVHQDWKDLPRAQKLELARKLLKEAGYGPGHPLDFTFSYRNSRDNPRIAPVVQQNWRDIGRDWVNVHIVGNDVQINYDKMQRGDFEVGDAGWVADFNDARNFLYAFETSAGEMNYGKYSNPDFDTNLRQSDFEKDANKRKELIEKAEKIALKDNAFIPIYFDSSRNLVNPNITGWADNPNDYHRSRYLCIK